MKSCYLASLFIYHAFLYQRIWTLENQNQIAISPSATEITGGLNLDKHPRNWYVLSKIIEPVKKGSNTCKSSVKNLSRLDSSQLRNWHLKNKSFLKMKNYIPPKIFIFYAFLYPRIKTLGDQNQLAKCPKKTGVTTDLNLDKISGNWYVIASSPPPGSPKVNKCVQYFVNKSSSNTLSMKLTEISSRNNMPLTFNANATITREGITGYWQFQGKKAPVILGPFKNILEYIKYESHFGMILCPANKSTYPAETQIVMILSREKNLSPTILEKMKSRYSRYIPEDQIQMVDQNSC